MARRGNRFLVPGVVAESTTTGSRPAALAKRDASSHNAGITFPRENSA